MQEPSRAQPDRIRIALAAVIALGHVVALAVLLDPAKRGVPVPEPALTLVSLPAEPVRPQPPLPPPHDPVRIDASAPAIDMRVDTATAVPYLPTGDCEIEAAVAEALAHDTGAIAAIGALGPGSRAATGAVMLWNGAWAHAADAGDSARLATLGPVIVAAIRAAPIACQQAERIGPRLIAVAEKGRTTLFAIGSGRWRWRDLLSAPAAS